MRISFRRIVVVIYSMGGGGAERVAANLANHWSKGGLEITLITLASSTMDVYELHPAVKRISLNLASNSDGLFTGFCHNLRRILTLRRALKKTQPDIALGMMTSANVLLAFAALGMSTRTIGSEHVHPPHYPLSPLWKKIRKHAYGYLNAVTALTNESASWLEANTNVGQVSIIPNAALWPLPLNEPQIDPQSVCLSGRKILLAVGRLETQKGFDWLVEAFAALAQNYSEWDLVIVGEGSMRGGIEQHVYAAGLGGRVFLPGWVGNLSEWYEYADLYVMSSRFEGFGNTLAEALTYGLPVISFDCDTGPRDIIRHETDGLLVPPGDVPGLVAAMYRLMGDAPLRRRFAERAVEARVRFSDTHIIGIWEQLFEDTFKKKG